MTTKLLTRPLAPFPANKKTIIFIIQAKIERKTDKQPYTKHSYGEKRQINTI